MAEDRRDNTELVNALRDAMVETQQFHVDDIKAAIHEHRNGDHHKYIEKLIERDKIRAERLETLKTQTFGWGIIVFLSGIGTAVYNFFIKGH